MSQEPPPTPAGEAGPEPDDESRLIEEVAGAFRPRDPRQVAFLPAWHDLSAAGREAAFELSLEMRAIEAALDPEGYSSTVRAVLDRLGA